MTNIFTERLVLNEFTKEDAAFIFELLNSPTWIQFIGDRGIKTLEDAENYIVNKLSPSYERDGFGFYVVKLKENGLPIGLCGLIKRDSLEHVDIGFAFLQAYTGKGYAFEAAMATLEHAKNIGINHILGFTTADNIHSIRLLEKIGLVYEKKIYLPNDPDELMLFGKSLVC